MKIFYASIIGFISLTFSVFSQTLPVHFDLNKIPFAFKGSYMTVGMYTDSLSNKKLYVRDISGNKMWINNDVFLIEPIKDGKLLAYNIQANSTEILLSTAEGKIEFCFQNADVLRIKGQGGIGLKLTQIAKDNSNLIMPVSKGQWRLQQGGNAHYVLTTLSGTSKQSGERYSINQNGLNHQVQGDVYINVTPSNTKEFEVALEQYPYGWEPKEYLTSFNFCLLNAEESLGNFVKKSPEVSAIYSQANLMACYLNWSCTVNKRGFINREIIYTSKNVMRAAWSWDHCFTAMALAYKSPLEAWNNYMIMFDHQNETGSFPDFMNDRQALWGFVKPPIHGWTFRKMMKSNPIFTNKIYLDSIYTPLQKWTNFWFKYHDDDKDGIPEYHHGNDAGWDNASNFDLGFQAESPDLSAYLALQMDVLAEIANKLGKKEEADFWAKRSDKQIKLMVDNFWDGKHFVTKRMDSDTVYNESKSLMSYLPLVLGKKLPKDIAITMINDLKTNGQFTKIGLASENPSSKLYRSDSYWRGPVWAPPTLIIASGIEDIGDHEFAKEIAKKFAENCNQNGFAENYDALSGKGLRDNSLTWSSSVFQILAHEYLLKK